MTRALHAGLASDRWKTFDLFEQLGNIGSEVGRAVNAKSRAEKQLAGIRALELFDLTLADSRWYGRGGEIARAREVVCDYLFGDNEYQSTGESLEQYFMQFAVAARLQY